MPTLIRLVVVLFVVAALATGAMLALAYLVEPNQREMVVEIPSDRLGL